MSKQLWERAEAIRARYRALEAKPKSGYHDMDILENVFPIRFLAPQKNGLPHASRSLVHFTDHKDKEQVHFVGADASAALTALQNWRSRMAADLADCVTMTGTDRKLCLKIIPRLQLDSVDGVPVLTIHLRDWNDVLAALQAENVGLHGANFVDDGTDVHRQA